ncbi:MAG: hypothetical protein ACM3PY_00175 [Omnitrophica WOR_2 bacterium]
MFQFFSELLSAFWEEWKRFLEDNFRVQDPKVRLENQLRLMYGRGEITQETFHQLRFRLNWGRLGQGDLGLIHREALRKLEALGRLPIEHYSPEILRSLDRLYIDHVLLEEARLEIQDRQKALEQEIDWLKEQAGSARQNAQDSLPDEDGARLYLEIWQHLTELASALDQRLLVLVQQFHSLQAQEAEINASISQLKMLGSQEKLTGLRYQIRQDFLPPGQNRLVE